MPVDLAEVLAARGGLAELRDLLVDEIVDRLEIVGLAGGVPGLEARAVADERLSTRWRSSWSISISCW